MHQIATRRIPSAGDLIRLAFGLTLLAAFACNGTSDGEFCGLDCAGFCEAMAECPLALEGDCMSQCEALAASADADTAGDDCADALCEALSCTEGIECDGFFITIQEGSVFVLGGCYDEIDDINDSCEELVGERPPDKPDGPRCPDC